MGVLYIVATPIGNLEDITLRALRILREASLIAAEDTRTTRKLLAHYDIHTPLTSYFEHNKLTKLDYLLGVVREPGRDVAVVSEAGMPGISDPGYELVRAALAAGIKVVPVPGPSAIITALAASGLPTDEFTYVGFLPRKRSERLRHLSAIATERRTLIAFEAPHRLVDSLRDLLAVLGSRRIAVARELTKLHEEIVRGTIEQALAHFEAATPRGELCLVIAGAEEEKATTDIEEVRNQLRKLAEQGLSAKEAAVRVAKATGVSKREVYKIWLDLAADDVDRHGFRKPRRS